MTIDSMLSSIIDDYKYINNKNSVSINSYKIFEKDNNIVFKCLAPGMDKEDINISFNNKKLYIKSNSEKSDKDFRLSFNDSVYLCKSINTKESFAKLDKGILTITMPLHKKEENKKISFI
tara:strand:+ start:48 stop:407 length:360 start_codon:yes stop_codon:yes gene_type:complete